MKKFKYLDLFAGAGGLTDGFMQSGNYDEVASVEWLKPQVDTLRHRLKTKWGHSDADEEVMRFDIQREKELFGGWQDDEKFGSGKGLDYFVGKHHGIDLVIGGPPCQAYSIVGRARMGEKVLDDPRNNLYKFYVQFLEKYQPKMFVFENVPGIRTAKNGEAYRGLQEAIDKAGYEMVPKVQIASQHGVLQNRQRVIIVS